MVDRKLSISILVFFLAVCLSNPAPAAVTADLSGSWQGNWSSDSGGKGGLSAVITQSGNTLSGSLTVRNTECGDFSNRPLSGQVSGNVASFNASARCSRDGSNNSLNYTNGVVSGNVISGDYNVYHNGEFWDSGTFTLTRSVNTIKASAGPGGRITPSGTVSVTAGSNKTFTIEPDPGYRILDVKVDGVSVGARTSYTFTSISSNHTISATFILKPAALVPIISLLLGDEEQSEPGTISLSKTSVSFSAQEGGGSPSAQTVPVTNTGPGILTGLNKNITYGNGQPTGWLAAALSSDTAPATLSLQATTGSLADGTYNANVAVLSPAATNSPQNIAVTFTVSRYRQGPR